jgi:putative FmdB family regulatory protein
MPIYEYRCSQCENVFELKCSFSQADAPATCPSCGAPAEKLISVFSSTFGYGIQGPAKEPLRESAKKSKKRSKSTKSKKS